MSGRAYCVHCQKDFSLADSTQKDPPRCQRCHESYEKHGEPKACAICASKSAFGSEDLCRHCKNAKSKYGDPIPCESCGKQCAFKKPREKQAGGQNLCFVCARDLASNKHKESKAKKRREEKEARRHSEKKRKRAKEKEERSAKKRRKSSSGASKSNNEENQQIEALQKEVATLRKQNEQQRNQLARVTRSSEAKQIQLNKLKKDLAAKDAEIGKHKGKENELSRELDDVTRKAAREKDRTLKDQQKVIKKLRAENTELKNELNSYKTEGQEAED